MSTAKTRTDPGDRWRAVAKRLKPTPGETRASALLRLEAREEAYRRAREADRVQAHWEALEDPAVRRKHNATADHAEAEASGPHRSAAGHAATAEAAKLREWTWYNYAPGGGWSA